MKLACASGAFHRQLERGDLTQLEFLESCAREFACDGTVLDARHFPRTDSDYLAQIKKMATDLGLEIAALQDGQFFGSGAAEMERTLACALALGAPLLTTHLTGEREQSWSTQLAALNQATALAKAANVTVALRNAPDTYASGVYECKRVSKETDSAWLRFGLEPQAFDAGSKPADLAARTVLLWSVAGQQTGASIDAVLDVFADFRGYLVIDEPSGTIGAADATNAIRSWRIALASRVLRSENLPNHT